MQVSLIHSIGQQRAKDLEKMGITTAEGLVRLYPRAYLDLTERATLRFAAHNETVLIACEVVRLAPPVYGGKRYVKAFCAQDSFSFTAVWFNQPYIAKRLKTGEYLFYGRVQRKFGAVSIVNPTFEPIDKNYRLKGIVPVYPLKGGLNQATMRKAIKEALSRVSLESFIPRGLQSRYHLPPLDRSYYAVHMPPDMPSKDAASERIALEEYFLLLTAFRLIKGGREVVRTNKYSVTAADVKAFSQRFSFEFTDGQKRAVNEIFTGVYSPSPMNRLLQGDVGSGKTAVALCGIYMAVKSGYQAAYLSPTEVLAAQNYSLLQKYFPDYKVAYLAGSMTAKEKKETKEKLHSGEVDIICGTHAVIQSDVQPQKLAFIVCDEQHRFGVAQRNALSEKGEGVDMLVMSATPIPRTLSLIFYGDLDITTITDKPKARQEVSTSLISPGKYEAMLDYIGEEVKKGKQAYFVCAKIGDDDAQNGDSEDSIVSVKERFEELKERLPFVRFALLHGKMKEKEKDATMAAFKNGEYDCLVSTTVIEVGVDVPNATIMVIYNADRFGLSQLHQLRGRVGRGTEKSYCFLLSESDSDTAKERLLTLKNTTDGFKIAEKDLEMRGGGDFLGTRQSGRMLADIKNLKYGTEVIFEAKKLVDETFAGGLDSDELRRSALKKYESLKDVVMN